MTLVSEPKVCVWGGLSLLESMAKKHTERISIQKGVQIDEEVFQM